MPVGTSRTTPQVTIAQGGPGSLTIFAGATGMKVYATAIVLVLDAAGTIKFQEGGTDLCGPIALAANGGFVVVSGSDTSPVLSTNTPGLSFGLVTTGGKASGWVRGFVDF